MGIEYLNGWDAMVATTQENLNKGILKAYNAGLLPTSVEAPFEIVFFGIPIPANIKCRLGSWRMSGGSGKNVEITIPFIDGQLTISDKNYKLNGVAIKATCLLSYIKSPIQPQSGTDYTLQVNFDNSDAIVAISVLNPPFDPPFDQDEKNTLDIAMLNFLKKVLGKQSTYDIVTVNLQAVKDDYPYLIPKLFEYAVDTNTTDPNSTVFGIQMLTVSDAPGSQAIIPGTIPIGSPLCNAAVLVSNKIFTKQLLLPGIANALKVDESKLTARYAAGAWQIINAKDITLDLDYNPTVTSLSASIDNNLLNLVVIGNVDAAPGINISFTITATYELQISTANNVQTLKLVQVSQNADHTVSVATWVIIATAALAGLVMVVYGPLAGFIFAAIATLITYLVAIIADNEAGEILSSSLPLVVPSNVKWNHLEYFTMKQALMPTPLQLGGTIPLLSHD